jgi:hypothetical protein
MIGTLKALGFGSTALLDKARTKAVLLGLGKNPGGSVSAPTPPSTCQCLRGSVSTASRLLTVGSSRVPADVSTLGSGPEG